MKKFLLIVLCVACTSTNSGYTSERRNSFDKNERVYQEERKTNKILRESSDDVYEHIEKDVLKEDSSESVSPEEEERVMDEYYRERRKFKEALNENP